jgi:hypothetical protein
VEKKSPGVDHISAELIETGGREVLSDIHQVINSIWDKEECPQQ